MKVSVVTAYFNRRRLFYNTLLQLQTSAIKDFEVIAVDDGSSEDNRLEDLTMEFPFLKVIRLAPADKWYTNPCIPFNIGFREAKGEIIIIQNPECLHYGDILKYVVENLKPGDYLNFGSYSLDRETTDQLDKSNIPGFEQAMKIEIEERKVGFDGDAGWYNHPVFNPKGYHWCSALTRDDLTALKGFDERFALGIAFDDDEFLFRIKKMGLNFRMIESPFVLHQNHYYFDLERKRLLNQAYQKPDGNFLIRKNKYLLARTVASGKWQVKTRSKEKLIRADFFLTKKLKSIDYINQWLLRIKYKIVGLPK